MIRQAHDCKLSGEFVAALRKEAQRFIRRGAREADFAQRVNQVCASAFNGVLYEAAQRSLEKQGRSEPYGDD